MDGGITPERISSLDPDLNMNVALSDWPGENDLKEALCLLAPGEKFPADGEAVIRGCCHSH